MKYIYKISLLLGILIGYTGSYIHGQAQICGCTDPLAKNYNSIATINDGSCLYRSVSVKPILSFDLSSELHETSGLIFWDHKLWTHNDNSDQNLYSLDPADGILIQKYPVKGITNKDWEEISEDENYIYIGDFGNNFHGNRSDLKIYRIDKKSLLVNNPLTDSICFSYSDQSDFSPDNYNSTDFDCEAFIVSSDSIYLFTKQWHSLQTSVYALPKSPGKYTARLKTTYNVHGLITGATYLESKKILVLCGYGKTLHPFSYLLYDFKGTDFFSGNKRKIKIDLPFHQTEGVATANGLVYYFSNENFSASKIHFSGQQLHLIDFSPYLHNYLFNTLGKKINIVSFYSDPACNVISIKYNKDFYKKYSETEIGRTIILSGILKDNSFKIKANNLKKGNYFIKIGNSVVFKWGKV